MIAALLLGLLGAGPATVVLMEGAVCGSRDSDEILVRVLDGHKEVAARVQISTAFISDKGDFVQNDVVSGEVKTGPGYVKLKWKPLSDVAARLVKAGWFVLGAVVVYFRDQPVASVAFDLTRKGGRCLLVQL